LCETESSGGAVWRLLSDASVGAQVVAKLTADMKRVAMEQRLAFVATVCPDGTPNLSPKGTIAVWDDDHLVFADIRSPGTIANINKNPAVEVNVVDPFARKGYRFKGVGEVVVDGALFEEIMRFYQRRWVDTARSKAEPSIRGFVLIKVETALPLISPAYDDASSDEQSIRMHWISYFAALHER
jgi:predicted pyridoxine 5'-phosphate oxidase superfamily flavin-nucleotide-binding protein